MKIVKIIFLAFFLILMNLPSVLAKTPPPKPSVQRSATALNGEEEVEDDPGTPAPEDVPIDRELVYLMIGGLILGMSVLYKKNIKNASM